jgi:hypothetical protein
MRGILSLDHDENNNVELTKIRQISSVFLPYVNPTDNFFSAKELKVRIKLSLKYSNVL